MAFLQQRTYICKRETTVHRSSSRKRLLSMCDWRDFQNKFSISRTVREEIPTCAHLSEMDWCTDICIRRTRAIGVASVTSTGCRHHTLLRRKPPGCVRIGGKTQIPTKCTIMFQYRWLLHKKLVATALHWENGILGEYIWTRNFSTIHFISTVIFWNRTAPNLILFIKCRNI